MKLIYITALVFLVPVLVHGQMLSPQEAVTILRASHSWIDMTDVYLVQGDGPYVVILESSPTSGPFGEFKPFPPTAPLSRGPNVFRVSLRSRNSPRVRREQASPQELTTDVTTRPTVRARKNALRH